MKVFSILIMLLLITLTPWTASAREQQGSDKAGQELLTKADAMNGSDVVDSRGKKLGKVDNVALDLQSGRISYVVVDPGKGDKLVPVPYNMFGVLRNKQLVLNIDRDRLDAAPSYGKRGEPNWANQQWTQQVASFWGAAPSGTMTGQTANGPAAGSQQPTPMGTGSQQQGDAGQQQTLGVNQPSPGSSR